MAAYEVLLLNTAIPQIQAAQSGDTYVVPRDIAINATAIISANSATDALRITQTGAGNAILVEDSANPDSTPFVVTAAGDVGVGTSSPGSRIHGAVAANGTPILTVQNTSTSQSSYGILFDTELNNAGSRNWALISEYAAVGDFHIVRSNAKDGNPFSAGTSVLAIDSSGNLGLGVTPSAWASGWKALQLPGGSLLNAANTSTLILAQNAFVDTNWKYTNNGFATRYDQDAGTHQWWIAPNNTSGAGAGPISFTQAMTLDASGRLGIGPTLVEEKLHVSAANPTNGVVQYLQNTSSASQTGAKIKLDVNNVGTSGLGIPDGASNALAFFVGGMTSASERARITSGGYFKASDNGTYTGSTGAYHEFNQSANSGALLVHATNASYSDIAFIVYAARNTTNNSFYALSYYNTGANAYKFRVADSGDVTNTNGTYGTISDAKMKTDIVDAGSQWSDIKALRFRKFKMKDDPSGLVQLGVVAQEVELTSPGLVDEHADRDAEGNDLGTTTKSVKTSVLLMKAAVALQEAMARIETLEAEVAALKGA